MSITSVVCWASECNTQKSPHSIPLEPNVFSFVMISGTMSNTTENENWTLFSFFGYDFYIASRSAHYAIIYIIHKVTTQQKCSRAKIMTFLS